ncbi:MAG: hypothetical protein HGA24_03425 [Candidatus Aminicenantes bacterium]|nr:hypothetical protein [Candidatus Aminicenantes bacterium]
MLKRTAFWLLAAVLVAAVSATAIQRPQAQTATKTTAQTAVTEDAAREAAENRLCEGLKVVQAKLGQIERSVSSATKLHSDFKVISGRIKAEKLMPLYDRRTIETTKTAQVKARLTPVEQVRTLTRINGQIRGIKDDVLKIRGTLQAQLADLQKSWGIIERDMKRVAGLRAAGAVKSNRPCVIEEAKRAQGEMATLGTQASNLQSEIDDLRAILDQEYGQGPCGDQTTCQPVNCADCCAWQHKITAPEGSTERSIQEAERAQCQIRCTRIESACAFKNFDQKANQLFNLLSSVLKSMKEMQSGIARNLL